MKNRTGEGSKRWFRSERIYHTNLGWWFLTRESTEKGPFFSQKDAECELILYLRQQTFAGLYPTM